MAHPNVVLTLRNEVEASLLEAILREQKIPHFIRSFGDSAYGPIFRTELGWGQIEAPPEYHERILAVYADLPSSGDT